MAFDEVTLFEFDLTDAQFGPQDMNVPQRLKGKVDTSESAEGDVEANLETEDDSGGGIGRLLLIVAAIAVVGLVAKRMRGGSDEEESTPIEFEEDEETAPEIGA